MDIITAVGSIAGVYTTVKKIIKWVLGLVNRKRRKKKRGIFYVSGVLGAEWERIA